MTPEQEDEIERVAEREMNRLDKELLSGALTQEDYDEEVEALDQWVREEYKGTQK
jgi:hypothetical protein